MRGVSGPYPLGLGRPAHPGGTLEDSRVPCDTRSAAESRATAEENSPHLMERKSVRSLGKDLHDPRTMLPVTSVAAWERCVHWGGLQRLCEALATWPRRA